MSEQTTSFRTTQLMYWFVLAAKLMLVFPLSCNAENCTDAPVSGQLYSIINHGSGMALDISGNLTVNRTDLIQWPYKGGNGPLLIAHRWMNTQPIGHP